MRTCTCNVVVSVCALACVAGCGSSVRVTRDGKAIRSPVSVIVIRDFTAESGVHVPEEVVQGITSTCVRSLSDEARIKPVPVTRETSIRLPDGAIDVRGRFERYRVGTWTMRVIGSPGAPAGTMDLTELKVQMSVHDVATGKLLASKAVKGEIVGGVYNFIACEVRDVVLTYLKACGRKLGE